MSFQGQVRFGSRSSALISGLGGACVGHLGIQLGQACSRVTAQAAGEHEHQGPRPSRAAGLLMGVAGQASILRL